MPDLTLYVSKLRHGLQDNVLICWDYKIYGGSMRLGQVPGSTGLGSPGLLTPATSQCHLSSFFTLMFFAELCSWSIQNVPPCLTLSPSIELCLSPLPHFYPWQRFWFSRSAVVAKHLFFTTCLRNFDILLILRTAGVRESIDIGIDQN